MKRTVKTGLWVLAGTFLLLVVLAIGATIYLVHHPSCIRDALTHAASQATGMDVRVQSLEWSLKPLRVRAAGIEVVSRDEDAHGVELTLDEVTANGSLEGRFGDRTLVIENIRAQGLSAIVRGRPSLGNAPKGRVGPSWVARAGVALLRKLLFRDVRIEQAELARAQITADLEAASFRAEDLHIALVSSGDLTAETRIHLSLPESATNLDFPRIRFQSTLPKQLSPAEPIQGRFQADQGTLKTSTGVLEKISFKATLFLDPESGSLQIAPFEAGTGDLRSLLPVSLPGPVEAHTTVSSRIHLKESRIEKGPFRVSLQGPSLDVSLKGHMQGSWADAFHLSLEDMECRLLPERLIPLLPSDLREPLSPMSAAGEISLSGAVSLSTEEDAVRIQPDLTLRLKDNEVQWALARGSARGRISGHVQVSGAWPGLSTTCAVRADTLALDHPSVHIAEASAAVRMDGPLSDLRLQELELQAPEVLIGPSGESLPLRNIHVQASAGNLNPWGRIFRLPEITVNFDDLARFHIRAVVQPGETSFQVHGKDLDLLTPVSREQGLLAGWNPQALSTLRVQATRNKDAPWILSSRVAFQGLSLENQDMELYGEGLDTVLTLDGRMETSPARFTGVCALEASAGELLLDRFYLNLEKNPLSLRFQGAAIPGNRALDIGNLEAGLAGLLSASASGRMQGTPDGVRGMLSLSIPEFPLTPAFRQFVVEPFRMQSPWLQSLSVEGEASGECEVSVEEAGTGFLAGIRVQNGTVSREAASFAFEGIDLSLPLAYREGAPAAPAEPSGKGYISIQSMILPLLPDQPLDIHLEAQPNRLLVHGPVRIRIPGGDLLLDAVRLAYETEQGIRAETALTLDEVALHPLLSRFWPGSPQGVLSGSLDSIRYVEGRLETRGQVRAELFDGHVVLEDFGISRLFSSGPLLRFHARWEDLNLEEMTTGTPFGRVTGLLRGRVEDFEMAYGQPQRFDLLLETVDREGVDQRISVKAVDNIARIGGGGSPFVGMAGFFTSLFREFPYEKIGVHALLQNDVFRINGTIHDDGKEYLVKRSGFSGVNVVNQNPDNRIRFKDMVKRIQRVTASRSGPVIR